MLDSFVQAVRSKVNMVSQFGSIIMECRRMLSTLNIDLFFIYRSANMAGQCLTRESCFYPGRIFDGRSVPVEVQSCVLADKFE